MHFDEKTRYPVDGYDLKNRIVYQFHGCSFHGHGCRYDSATDGANRRQATNEVTCRLRGLGYVVVEKWECEWQEERKLPDVKLFLTKT